MTAELDALVAAITESVVAEVKCALAEAQAAGHRLDESGEARLSRDDIARLREALGVKDEPEDHRVADDEEDGYTEP